MSVLGLNPLVALEVACGAQAAQVLCLLCRVSSPGH